MPGALKPGAVIFAKDLERLARFYERLLTFRVSHAEPDHVVLESEAFELVIHAIPEHIASSIVISEPPEVREETPIKLFFAVENLAQARAAAAQLGGLLAPVQREWQGAGFRVCDGHDPEGNVFQLRQSGP
ncbi:MAG: VOC family protein [Burkholderiaceae bacterium]